MRSHGSCDGFGRPPSPANLYNVPLLRPSCLSSEHLPIPRPCPSSHPVLAYHQCSYSTEYHIYTVHPPRFTSTATHASRGLATCYSLQHHQQPA